MGVHVTPPPRRAIFFPPYPATLGSSAYHTPMYDVKCLTICTIIQLADKISQ